MPSKVEIKYTQLFINNEFVNAKTGRTFPTYDPATEEEIAQVQEAGEQDVDLAVKAARDAFQMNSQWRKMDASERGALLYKFAQLMRRDEDYLARLETLDNGKTYSESMGDIDCSIKCMEYYAGWADKIHGQTIPVDGPNFCYTRHEPIGVCGQIIPWNYPIMMAIWKFGPALACGNTIVLKPAELTPLSSLYLGSLFREAGFPAGVVNIIPGYGHITGNALAMHMDVNKIAFTGSAVTGRKIQESSAKSNLKRVTLELGGKSPFIIFDVDDEYLQKAAEDTAFSIFSNQGQSCCASSRVFVHEKVYDEFIKKLKKIADEKVVGDPFDEKTTSGALINETQFKKVVDYIDVGVKEGARLVSGGERVGKRGFFLKPTIFADCSDEMRIAKEEIFGPVVSVFKFKEEDEVIRRANATTYGLGSGLYSKDINQIIKVSNALEAGTVWVNSYETTANQAPFGGYKQSGFGRELGEYGLHEYTEVKTVSIKIF